MATTYTRRIEEMKAEIIADAEKKEKEQQKEQKTTSSANRGSLAAKANMVSEYNNRNNK